MKKVLAFDFGASSGRALLGSYDKGDLHYQELYRFENIPLQQEGTLCWNYERLLDGVRQGIRAAGVFDSVAFDTWGVDFGLLDSLDRLIALPVHYRDNRTEKILEQAFCHMGADELYQQTGTQIMPINTLFQLLALRQQHPDQLKRAKRLLFMPDLLAFFLSGKAVCERSIASTSQMLSPKTKNWSEPVFRAFGICPSLFAGLVKSGSVVGPLKQGFGVKAKVLSVAGHDTQCAVAAMPVRTQEAAFLSCGTWSLLGCELDTPIVSRESREKGFSNELGANGRINYLKNIIGLWLIQESRRQWMREGREYSFAQIERLAREAQPLQSFIDPDAPEFTPPGDIPQRIQAYCARTGQPVPYTVGQVSRCIYESLALKYRLALESLQTLTKKRFLALHILGGGSKSGLLCQLAACATGIAVLAGPVEATALGNMILQLVALGELADVQQGRALVAKIEPIAEYLPVDRTLWETALKRYRAIIQI